MIKNIIIAGLSMCILMLVCMLLCMHIQMGQMSDTIRCAHDHGCTEVYDLYEDFGGDTLKLSNWVYSY